MWIVSYVKRHDDGVSRLRRVFDALSDPATKARVVTTRRSWNPHPLPLLLVWNRAVFWRQRPVVWASRNQRRHPRKLNEETRIDLIAADRRNDGKRNKLAITHKCEAAVEYRKSVFLLHVIFVILLSCCRWNRLTSGTYSLQLCNKRRPYSPHTWYTSGVNYTPLLTSSDRTPDLFGLLQLHIDRINTNTSSSSSSSSSRSSSSSTSRSSSVNVIHVTDIDRGAELGI